MTGGALQGCFPPAGLPSVEAAVACMGTWIALPLTELVPAYHAAGRVLAREVSALAASPAYDRSAMDGFAFQFDGAIGGPPLHCIGRALAGAPYNGVVAPGTCVAIATGAMLPAGCDTVVMHEQSKVAGFQVSISGPITQGQNIRRLGEDFAIGASVLGGGMRLAPQHIGLLASAGCFEVEVYRRLRVAVLSIGDELSAVPNGHGATQILDSNRPMLLAYAACLNAETTDFGILPDQRGRIADTLQHAAARHDVVLCSAATAKGEGDYLHAALHDADGEILLAGVAIKPGKPVSFGRIGRCLLIGLPGNPAAALITFLTMGVPLLLAASGQRSRFMPPRIVRAGFAHRKKRGVRDYLRVNLTQGLDGIAQAQRCTNDGPAMLASIAESQGLVWVDEDVAEIAPGALLPFRSFGEFLE